MAEIRYALILAEPLKTYHSSLITYHLSLVTHHASVPEESPMWTGFASPGAVSPFIDPRPQAE
jgi:hypothetical protein